MAVEKNNGDVISFLKKKDYIMVDNALGNGSFGKTVILQDPYINELFVAKKYEPEYEEIREGFYKNFLDEIKILYKLNHPNIVRIFSYYPYEEIYTGYILMEFIDGIDIGTYIKKYEVINTLFDGEPSPDEIFIQLIDAFCYIESHRIIHRDLREGNIMIDKSGCVKVIDFGIGKEYNPTNKDDSLVNEINRASSDTLPNEYYSGEYTSLTDMFYLAELLNRLMREAEHPDEMYFSYQEILDKMMKKQPEERYHSFSEIKEAISKRDFINLSISDEDKTIYQDFANSLVRSIHEYNSEPKFNNDPLDFIQKLQKALQKNAFENNIQKNPDVINSIVQCQYTYTNSVEISCKAVDRFLKWFINSNEQSRELILMNLASKLSIIKYREPDPDLPF